MAASADYRQFAEEQRRAAEEACLPLVRQRHLAAADSWERIAQEQELFELTRRPRPDMIY
jgi:hypothetical protein